MTPSSLLLPLVLCRHGHHSSAKLGRCSMVNTLRWCEFQRVTHLDRSSEKGPVVANGIRRGRPLWTGHWQPQPQILEQRTGPPAPVDTAPLGPWPGLLQAGCQPQLSVSTAPSSSAGWLSDGQGAPPRAFPETSRRLFYTCFTSEQDPQVTWGSHGPF